MHSSSIPGIILRVGCRAKASRTAEDPLKALCRREPNARQCRRPVGRSGVTAVTVSIRVERRAIGTDSEGFIVMMESDGPGPTQTEPHRG